MRVHDYMPSIYEDNIHMNEILNAEDDELQENLKPSEDNEFKNQFAIIAEEQGISNFEKILQIKPDKTTETLENRRARVMNRLIQQSPFTERFLEQKLNAIIGEGDWFYNIDYNNYTLDLYITTPGNLWLDELQKLFEQIIPCNILYTINIYQASWQDIKDNFSTWGDIYNRGLTWQQVLNGDWSS